SSQLYASFAAFAVSSLMAASDIRFLLQLNMFDPFCAKNQVSATELHGWTGKVARRRPNTAPVKAVCRSRYGAYV
ncbi:MAG: hypothetical protein ACR2OM_04875, partial [Aestuariivirgaceae bacterium]